MKAEAEVKTSVTVDLGDFATGDLIEELEERGHAVDADSADELDTRDLVEELSRRSTDAFARVPLDRLIDALGRLGCPVALIEELREWERQPIPTKVKLEQWIVLCA